MAVEAKTRPQLILPKHLDNPNGRGGYWLKDPATGGFLFRQTDTKPKKGIKETHKEGGGQRLTKDILEQHFAAHDLVPNVLTTGTLDPDQQRITAPFDEDKGGLLYKRLAPEMAESYEEVLTVGTPDGHTEHFIPYMTIRSESWRHLTDGDDGISSSDTMQIRSSSERLSPGAYNPALGMEFEMLTTGRLEDLSQVTQSALDHEKATIEPELLYETVEVNFPPSQNIRDQAKANLRIIKVINTEAETQGQSIMPVSMFPHRITLADFRDDLYFQQMAEKMGVGETIFGSSHSVQFTIDNISPERGREAQNAWYQVGHLLKALSLSSPVAFDEINPNMRKILEGYQEGGFKLAGDPAFLPFVDHNEPLSVREAARYYGSPLGGGLADEPFPVPAETYYRAAEHVITGELTPTIDRVGGASSAMHHGNTRYRRTVGEHTATELANLDTFGGDPLKITPAQEIARALNQKFNLLSPQQLAELAPALFRPELTKADLEELKKDYFAIDNFGVEAEITDALGQKRVAQDLVDQLLVFAAAPYTDEARGINIPASPEGIVSEMKKSSQVPTENDYQKASSSIVAIAFGARGEPITVPSLAGFFETGIGTPAHWQRERIRALQRVGVPNHKIIEDYRDNAAGSYRVYLNSLTEADIDKLYEEKPQNKPQKHVLYVP